MPPVTKVLGARGEVLHDCLEAGCDVSWDGIALTAHEIENPAHTEDETQPAKLKVKKGEKVPGAPDELPAAYDVQGNRAKLKRS